MATSEPTNHHFMVYAPDNTDPGALNRRLSTLDKHIEGVEALTAEGVLSVYCHNVVGVEEC